MNKFKILITPGALLLLSMNLFSSAGSEQKDFNIIRNGYTTRVTSGDLKFSIKAVRPNTIPQTSEPVDWKIIGEASSDKRLGGISGEVSQVSWQTNTGQMVCETWISERKDLIAFRQTFTNKSAAPLKLKMLCPMYIDGSRDFSFGSIQDWRILEQFRFKNDLPKTEIPSAGKIVTCDPFFIINNNKGEGTNLFIGYLTFSLHLADIKLSFNNKGGLSNIVADCDFEGVEVPVNGSRTSQWIILTQGPDANALMTDYTEHVRSYYSLTRPQENAPSVYCTWYYHATNYTEELFKKDIAQFRKEHIPFDAFLIDECWDLNNWGDFRHNDKFPDGMKWVAGQISSLGYMPGIWTAPFLVDRGSDLAKSHPEWLLKNSKGALCIFKMDNRDHNILDLTYPGVCDYLEDQFRKIARDWGFRYFKFDFMRSVFINQDQRFYDRTSTTLEAYRKGLEAIRRGVGNGAYISVCGGHYGASLGIAQSQRSGSDVKSEWNNTELPKYRQNILRTWMSGLWQVDPDAMMVRRQQTANTDDKRNLTLGLFSDNEAFTNTINQFLGGNLVTFTEDFSRIDEDRKMLYRHIIPSVNASSRPLDVFNPVCPEIMLTRIHPKCKALDGWNMVTIVNWSDSSRDYSITLDRKITGDLKGNRFLVYDFREMKLIGNLSVNDVLELNGVGAHESKLLKIVAWDGNSAMFIGTDLSFSCGGTEISEISCRDGLISGTLQTEWLVPVRLSFVIPAPDGYQLKQSEIAPGQRRFSFIY